MPTAPDPDALLRQVARIIDRERSERGITQNELGALAGIAQSTISKYLRVELRLNLSQFDAICSALGLKPGQVLDEADAMRDTA